MAKLDLNKLKDEINTRKSEVNMVSSRYGETVGRGVAPRDSFLNGLLESLHTGRETPSTVLMKTVENKTAAKKGEKPKLTINEDLVAPRQTQQRTKGIDDSLDRDEQLYADLETKRKQTLADSIQSYQPQYPPQYPNQPQYPQQYPQQYPPANGMQLNEAYLSENVIKIVNNHLVENFGPIVEEAIRSTIIEMYAVERIKEVIGENKDLIRTVVIDVIKEIQAKSKAKS